MIVALSTYPSRETAEEGARSIVEKELAACVSIIKIEQSVYRWKGNIEIHPEYLLIIKTTPKAYMKLEMHIKETHPHKVPEIIYFEVKGGNKEYIQWVQASTLSKLLRVPLDLTALKRASDPSNELNSAKNPSVLSK
jgi:periplasmic divalent cation tolerance protein